MPGSLTTIKRSPTTGAIEIIHRLHNHDAEEGLAKILADRSVTLDALENRAELALYVEEQFIIAVYTNGKIGAPLQLELIGAELDGEFVLIYQELREALPAAIAVRNGILRDVFPAQVNHVNVALGAGVHSLTFQGEDEWHTTGID